MSDLSAVSEIYRQFKEKYSGREEQTKKIWEDQSERFRDFWQNKMMNDYHKILSDDDLIPIVQILDVKGLRRNEQEKTVIGVALAFIRQPGWYRVFRDIKGDMGIRNVVDTLLTSTLDDEQTELLNRIYYLNTKKNGLTGRNGIILNCFLFAYNTDKNFAIVSLGDRLRLLNFLGLASDDEFEDKNYGECMIETRKRITSFKNNLDPEISNYGFSEFLYYEPFKALWKKE